MPENDIAVLKTRKEFLRAASRGKKHAARTIVIQAVPTPDDSPSPQRVGYTVTKKVGNAVVRNRIKRRMRAIVAEIFADYAQTGMDYVLIGRRAAMERDYKDLVGDVKYCLRKLDLAAGKGKPDVRPTS